MRKTLTALLVAAATLVVALSFARPASAAPTWAPAATAAVHPGVQTETNGAQCTSNFVYYDASDALYLGQAAHCAGTGSNTDTDGCTTQSLPLGTPVTVDGASKPGTLAYSSWAAMQAAGDTDPNECAYNDISLIKLDPADYGKVNPSVPTLGGPTGTATSTAQGDTVFTYGNSSLRAGVTLLSPKRGVSLGSTGGGWTHEVYTVSPGIPGDSGSGFMTADGKAFGVLSTLQLAPKPAANGVSDLSRMLAYMSAHGGPSVTLATGTEAFTGSIVG
jgi:hypothetical protein